MPFRDFAPHFQPEQLDKLNAAFEAAWPQLLFDDIPRTHLELRQLKQKLAHHKHFIPTSPWPGHATAG
jgi:hypothetical protein